MLKRVLTSLIILLFSIMIIPEVDAKPAHNAFTDDTFYQCVIDSLNKEMIDGQNDRSNSYSATDAELAKLTRLTCSDVNIDPNTLIKDIVKNSSVLNDKIYVNSTAGIEKLTGLQYLNLSSNYINHIDLSKNINLIELYLSDNQLTSIDLSKQINLVNLGLSNNKLTSINLSNNINLSFLTIHSNALIALTLPNENIDNYQTNNIKEERNVNISEQDGKYFVSLKELDASVDPLKVIPIPQGDVLYDLQNVGFTFTEIPDSINYLYQVDSNNKLEVTLNIIKPQKEQTPTEDIKQEVTPVPDTKDDKSFSIILFGCSLVLAGCGVFYFKMGKRKI